MQGQVHAKANPGVIGNGSVIAFDARPLNPKTRHWGVGVVIDNIVERLGSQFSFSGVSFKFPNAAQNGIRTWPAIPRTSNLLFEASPLLFRQDDGLYWGTNHFLPYIARIPGVVTVHDLLLLKYPNEQRMSGFLANRMLSSVRQAKRVVADSQTTADDLVAICPEIGKKTTVIHLGFRRPFKGTQASVDEKEPYLLMLGAHRPRKNLSLALRVINILRQKHPRYRLVVTGDVHDCFTDEVKRAGVGLELAGVVPAEQLSARLEFASALLFPSVYEGFGFPLLEAMAAGCPVIALDTRINREIAGDGAIFVSDQPADWAEKIEALLSSPSMRVELREKGYENLRRFSWEKTAAGYAEVFRSAMG